MWLEQLWHRCSGLGVSEGVALQKEWGGVFRACTCGLRQTSVQRESLHHLWVKS